MRAAGSAWLLVALAVTAGCGGDDAAAPSSIAQPPLPVGSAPLPPSASAADPQAPAGFPGPADSSSPEQSPLTPPSDSPLELQLPLRPPRAVVPPVHPDVADDGGFSATMMTALSQGHLTMNNRWTQADIDALGVPQAVDYQRTVNANMPGQVRPHTTLVQQYHVKRRQCVEHAGILNANKEASCYPVNEFRVFGLGRYGYYCGGDFPATGSFFRSMPEPLDGVDYCCRLHDHRVWNAAGYSDECGIALCLSKASGSPGVLDRLPDVKEARDFWLSRALLGCPFTSLAAMSTAPAPVTGP